MGNPSPLAKDARLVHELVTGGEAVGANAAFFAALVHDKELFRGVVEFIRREKAGPVYDAAAVSSLLELEYSGGGLRQFGKPPPPLPGFLTFFDPGWSILRLRPLARRKRVGFDQDWYDREPFAKARAEPCYRQLRTAVAPGSLGKSFGRQHAFLLNEEEVPPARVVVTGMVIHFLASGEFLLRPHKVRCLDLTTDGHRVEATHYGGGWIELDHYVDHFNRRDVGLAAVWRPHGLPQ